MPNTTTLHDAIAGFIPTLKSPRTAKMYLFCLERFEKIAPLELANVDETFLIPFHESLSGKAEATKAIHMSAVTALFAYLVYTKQTTAINLDMARLIKKKLRGHAGKRISNYRMQDIQTVIDYAENLTSSILELRDRALIITLAKTGLRASEAASLKLRDVDLEQGQAVVIGKGDVQAVIYFGSALGVITDYLQQRRDKYPNMPLFTHCDSHNSNQHNNPEHLSGGGIWNTIAKRAIEALGHKRGIHPHTFRSYFVTRVWEAKHDLLLAKELARHASVETTMRYIHTSNDRLKGAHAEIFS